MDFKILYMGVDKNNLVSGKIMLNIDIIKDLSEYGKNQLAG